MGTTKRQITDSTILAGLTQPGVMGRSGRQKSIDEGSGLKNIIVPVSAETHRAFKKYCFDRDLDMSTAVRAYITSILAKAEELEAEELERKKQRFEAKWKNVPGAEKVLDEINSLSIEEQLEMAEKEGI